MQTLAFGVSVVRSTAPWVAAARTAGTGAIGAVVAPSAEITATSGAVAARYAGIVARVTNIVMASAGIAATGSAIAARGAGIAACAIDIVAADAGIVATRTAWPTFGRSAPPRVAVGARTVGTTATPVGVGAAWSWATGVAAARVVAHRIATAVRIGAATCIARCIPR